MWFIELGPNDERETLELNKNKEFPNPTYLHLEQGNCDESGNPSRHEGPTF